MPMQQTPDGEAAVLNAIESRSDLTGRESADGRGAESDLPHVVGFVTVRHGIRQVFLVLGLGR